MNRFEWKSTINLNIKILKLVGLWPPGDESYKKNFYTLYSATILIVFVCGHNFFQAVNLFFILDDFDSFTASIFVTLSTLASVLKSYSLVQNMSSLKHLFVTIRDQMFLPKNQEQIMLIKFGMRIWKSVFLLINFVAGNCVLFWTAFPILDGASYRLPFLAWYPFRTTVSPNYELVYLYQVAAIAVIAMVNVNIDSLIGALNMIIGAQCDILCDNLKNLNTDNFEQDFIRCIRHHKAIVE